MALKETQQILEALKRYNRPLICISAGAGPDGYASALGLARVLRKLEKKPVIVAADGKTPKQLQFLENHEIIQDKLQNLRRFVIELDATKTKVDELSYEIKDNKLLVNLSPKKGFWSDKDVRLSSTEYRHDLIITVGAQDLEACGCFYENDPEFFYRTPIINIDHTPANEHFGQLNIVDLTASAVSEVCHDLIEAIEPGLIDEHIATAFLTGMIAKTKSFKTSNVTPKTLQTASKLIAKGANREQIVRHLYRTRSVHTLRLWGRALARLKSDPDRKLFWTLLSQQDFLHAGAVDEDLPDVIDELLASSPDAKIVILLYEDRDKNIRGIIRCEHPLNALQMSSIFQPEGTRDEARFIITKKSIIQAERLVLETINKYLDTTK